MRTQAMIAQAMVQLGPAVHASRHYDSSIMDDAESEGLPGLYSARRPEPASQGAASGSAPEPARKSKYKTVMLKV